MGIIKVYALTDQIMGCCEENKPLEGGIDASSAEQAPTHSSVDFSHWG